MLAVEIFPHPKMKTIASRSKIHCVTKKFKFNLKMR